MLAGEIRGEFDDSLDLDQALQPGHPRENRWDYLLGRVTGREVIALEPHSAKQDEVSTIIRKKKAALAQLAGHWKQGKGVGRWIWVASGKVQFADTEKAKLRLAQEGILFVGGKVLSKHLMR